MGKDTFPATLWHVLLISVLQSAILFPTSLLSSVSSFLLILSSHLKNMLSSPCLKKYFPRFFLLSRLPHYFSFYNIKNVLHMLSSAQPSESGSYTYPARSAFFKRSAVSCWFSDPVASLGPYPVCLHCSNYWPVSKYFQLMVSLTASSVCFLWLWPVLFPCLSSLFLCLFSLDVHSQNPPTWASSLVCCAYPGLSHLRQLWISLL